MSDEKHKYSYDYWFNNDFHKEWHYGDENYYVNKFYEDIVFNLDLPEDGYIVILGTYKCVSFNKLCKKFGYDRCVGLDLHNPTNHPSVRIRDCIALDESDDLPIAFCHNDLGGFGHTPRLKIHGQKWAMRNIISGGYLLGNNNRNRLKIDIEKMANDAGMKNTYLEDLDCNEFDLSRISNERLAGYMLSKKNPL